MSDLNNIILNKYGANCVGYWPLNGNTNDLKNANHLSGGTAGSYVIGPDGEKSMKLNGSSQSISTASAIDLTGTDKITLFFYWRPDVYPTTFGESVCEFSTNSDLVTDGFMLLAAGNVANDPLRAVLKGNVGTTIADYYPATFGFLTPKWYSIAIVYDKSLATGEASLYINGRLATANAVSNQNNTNSFGNHTLFIGSRNNASVFSSSTYEKIALFNTALTPNQIKEISSYMRQGYSILNWMSYIYDDGEHKRGYRYGD